MTWNPHDTAPWLAGPAYVVLLLGVALAWGAWPRRMAQGALIALGAVGWVAVCLWIVAPALPVWAMQPLHESFSGGTLQHVVGRGMSQDYILGSVLSGWPVPVDLRVAYGWQIAWAGLAAATWAEVARRVLGDARQAALFVAPLLVGPWAWHMAMSATAATHVLFVQALVALSVTAAHKERRALPGALVALVGAVGVLWHMRLDPTILTLGFGMLALWTTMPAWREREESVRAWLAHHPLSGVGLLVGTFFGWLAVWWVLVGPDFLASSLTSLGSVAYFLGPLHVGAWTIGPVFAAAVPLGWSLLLLASFAGLRFRPVTLGLAWLAVLLAWRAYYMAGHGPHSHPPLPGAGAAPWELYRYQFLLAGPVTALALVGARTLQARVRSWVLAAGLLPPVVSALSFVPLDPASSSARWPTVFGIEADELDAFHTLVRWSEQTHGECSLISRVRDWGRPDGTMLWYGLRADGGWLSDLPVDAPAEASIAEVLAQLDPDGGCGVAWLSLDCRGTEDPGCEALRALRPIGEPPVARGLPLVHADHGPAPALREPYGLRRVPGYASDVEDDP